MPASTHTMKAMLEAKVIIYPDEYILPQLGYIFDEMLVNDCFTYVTVKEGLYLNTLSLEISIHNLKSHPLILEA